MKTSQFISCCILLLSFTGFGQEYFPMGLEMDEAAYEQLSFTSENIQSSTGRKSMDSAIDLTPYCPEIRKQGKIASCVGWAVGYGALTIERAIKNGWTNQAVISENASSALFIYNQLSNGACEQGISIINALNLVQQQGNCLAYDFDHDINDCSVSVTQDIQTKAKDNKIEDYLPLFRVKATAAKKIKSVKAVLAQKKPVIIGMKVRKNFYQIKKGQSRWWPNIGNTNYAGGHAMVVVGFDDTKFKKFGQTLTKNQEGGFKLMNSWGADWGEDGYIWVSYDDFAKFCRHGFAILLSDGNNMDFTKAEPTAEKTERRVVATTTSQPQLSGTFQFKQYQGWDNGHVFKSIPIQIKDNTYRLNTTRQIGEKFQLQVENGFKEGYIYVFTIDETGKGEIHFPRSIAYSSKFVGENESALLLAENSVLTIPTTDKVLELTQIGTDQLVVLFSVKKIVPDYLQFLVQELAINRNQLASTLHQILGKFMIPTSDIIYQKEQMGFEAKTSSGGKIVPIILSVSVADN